MSSTSASTSEEPDISLLLEEYKIVQTKLDKLGEDMFKVRSWCITLFTAVLAGAKLTGELSRVIVVLLVPVVFAFQVVEYRQRQIFRRTAKRGLQIESVIRRALRKSGKDAILGPRLATQLLTQGTEDKKRRRIRHWIKKRWQLYRLGRRPGIETAGNTITEKVSEGRSQDERSPTLWESMVTQADFLFYLAQYAIIVLLLFLCGQTTTPKTLDSTLNVQIGSNSFAIAVQKTNFVVTNFVVETAYTTNFIVKNAYTTNYTFVTNITLTNHITK